MQLKEKPLYEFGQFRIDTADRLLFRCKDVVPLPPKAFDLLLVLVENSGRVQSKEELMSRVWPDTYVEEANLSYYISTLRKALGDDKESVRYIETLPRRGYRFTATVVTGLSEEVDPKVPVGFQSQVATELKIETKPAAGQIEVERTQGSIAAGKWSKLRSNPVLLVSTTLIGVVIIGCATLYVLQSKRKAIPVPMRTVPLTSYPDEEFSSSLSPDGKLVAFCWQGGIPNSANINVYVKQIDTGNPLNLSNKKGRCYEPCWSPDGRYIAYIHGSVESDNRMLMIPALGGPERILYSTKSPISGLDWSSDGKTIAFTMKDRVEDAYNVYLLALDSMEARRLTSAPAGSYGDYNPSFSPDGKTVAFLRRLDGTGTTDIFITKMDADEPRRLTFDKRFKLGLVWTADGESLVFSSERLGVHKLWRISAAGGEPEQLMVGTENAYDPSISRNGNRLTYTQIFWDPNIWRIKSATSNEPHEPPVKLLASSQRDEFPCVSPDGKKIVFESTRSGSHELWVAENDGSNPIQLTSFGAGRTGKARWSPDGRQIAFESHSEEYPNIYLIGADGGSPRKLTDDVLQSRVPNWSRDGRWIYFASNRDGSWQVWKVPPAGGHPSRVTVRGGYEAMESMDGQFLYYNKYGFNTPGMFRMPASGGEEEYVFNFLQLDSVGDWCLTANGICFIERYDKSGKPSNSPSIKFFEFATRRISIVASLDADPGSNPGLNVSPDGKWFTFSKYDNRNHDIMLVENFR